VGFWKWKTCRKTDEKPTPYNENGKNSIAMGQK
jgi:hypothetical protein